MRPCKKNIPLVNWSNNELNVLLNKKTTTVSMKNKIKEIILTRKEKGMEFGRNFFSSKNIFWKLAAYRLNQEGKNHIINNHGKKTLLITNALETFDKMIEIHERYSKLCTGRKNKTGILKEFSKWKH